MHNYVKHRIYILLKGPDVSYLFSTITLFVLILLGFLIGHRFNLPLLKKVGILVNTTLYTLLFLMGLRLSLDPGVLEKLDQVGLLSLLFALATVGGTILFLGGFYLFFRRERANSSRKHNQPLHWKLFLGPLQLLSIVALGILTGAGGFWPPNWIQPDQISGHVLNALLFFIGIQMGQDGIRLGSAIKRKEILLLPLGTALGSLIGGGILSLFVPQGLGESLSIAGGFGWYSLSGVMITDLGNAYVGSIAFLSNIFRETLAMLLIPLLARTSMPNLAIGVAGATSMDVTLPLIAVYNGSDSVPLSVSHGSILSLLVPIVVPLTYLAFG